MLLIDTFVNGSNKIDFSDMSKKIFNGYVPSILFANKSFSSMLIVFFYSLYIKAFAEKEKGSFVLFFKKK